jgi:hypothetical protein
VPAPARLALPLDEAVDEAPERRRATLGFQLCYSVSWSQASCNEALDLVKDSLALALGCLLSSS